MNDVSIWSQEYPKGVKKNNNNISIYHNGAEAKKIENHTTDSLKLTQLERVNVLKLFIFCCSNFLLGQT